MPGQPKGALDSQPIRPSCDGSGLLVPTETAVVSSSQRRPLSSRRANGGRCGLAAPTETAVVSSRQRRPLRSGRTDEPSSANLNRMRRREAVLHRTSLMCPKPTSGHLSGHISRPGLPTMPPRPALNFAASAHRLHRTILPINPLDLLIAEQYALPSMDLDRA